MKESIEESKKAGLYITYARGNEIVREYPDGRIQLIGIIEDKPTIVEEGSKVELS